jgi:hypothetical protein
MTILVLAQKKILPFSCPINLTRTAERFYDLNQKGFITLTLILLIVFSIISYLAALFLTFDSGFKIQTAEREFTKLKNTAATLELQVQKEETSFAKDHKDILESMERVSSIKYLTVDNFAVSSPLIGY